MALRAAASTQRQLDLRGTASVSRPLYLAATAAAASRHSCCIPQRLIALRGQIPDLLPLPPPFVRLRNASEGRSRGCEIVKGE